PGVPGAGLPAGFAPAAGFSSAPTGPTASPARPVFPAPLALDSAPATTPWGAPPSAPWTAEDARANAARPAAFSGFGTAGGTPTEAADGGLWGDPPPVAPPTGAGGFGGSSGPGGA